MSFNDTNGLRVTESPELGPAMLRMEGAHNGPAAELTLQRLLLEVRQLKQQQAGQAASRLTQAAALQASLLTALDELRRHMLTHLENLTERQLAAARGRYEAQEAYLTAGFVGLVRGLSDVQASNVVAQEAILKELTALRIDMERRSFGGRWRRFWNWVRRR